MVTFRRRRGDRRNLEGIAEGDGSKAKNWKRVTLSLTSRVRQTSPRGPAEHCGLVRGPSGRPKKNHDFPRPFLLAHQRRQGLGVILQTTRVALIWAKNGQGDKQSQGGQPYKDEEGRQRLPSTACFVVGFSFWLGFWPGNVEKSSVALWAVRLISRHCKTKYNTDFKHHLYHLIFGNKILMRKSQVIQNTCSTLEQNQWISINVRLVFVFVYVPQKQLCSPQNVNCRDLEGRHSTPLHFAAGYNRVSVVEYLLHHGADVHAKDKGYVLGFSCVGFIMLRLKKIILIFWSLNRFSYLKRNACVLKFKA